MERDCGKWGTVGTRDWEGHLLVLHRLITYLDRPKAAIYYRTLFDFLYFTILYSQCLPFNVTDRLIT